MGVRLACGEVAERARLAEIAAIRVGAPTREAEQQLGACR
jgi:hypothetical protein